MTEAQPRHAVHAALVNAQAEIRAAGKSGDNKFDRYQYAKLEDYYHAAKPVLVKHGLAVTFSTDEVYPLDDRTTAKGGAEHCVRVRITGTITAIDGSSISCIGYGEGQDRADKAVYKAITGARKYVLAGLLAIPTSDDPESDEGVGHAAAPAVRPLIPRPPAAAADPKVRHEAACDLIKQKLGSVKGTEAIGKLKADLLTAGKTKLQILEELEKFSGYPIAPVDVLPL